MAGPIVPKFDQKVRKTILQKKILTNGVSLEKFLLSHTKKLKIASFPLKDGFYVLYQRTKSSQIKLKSQVDKKFTRHFRRSKFQKSRSLRESDHFSEGRRLTKMVKSLFNYSKLEKVRNLKIHTQTKQTTLNHLVANSLALALLKVEILNKKCNFLQMPSFHQKMSIFSKDGHGPIVPKFGQKVRKTILQKKQF